MRPWQFLCLFSPVPDVTRSDGTLAANIVVLTTLFSLLTITVGFFLLSVFFLVGNLR